MNDDVDISDKDLPAEALEAPDVINGAEVMDFFKVAARALPNHTVRAARALAKQGVRAGTEAAIIISEIPNMLPLPVKVAAAAAAISYVALVGARGGQRPLSYEDAVNIMGDSNVPTDLRAGVPHYLINNFGYPNLVTKQLEALEQKYEGVPQQYVPALPTVLQNPEVTNLLTYFYEPNRLDDDGNATTGAVLDFLKAAPNIDGLSFRLATSNSDVFIFNKGEIRGRNSDYGNLEYIENYRDFLESTDWQNLLEEGRFELNVQLKPVVSQLDSNLYAVQVPSFTLIEDVTSGAYGFHPSVEVYLFKSSGNQNVWSSWVYTIKLNTHGLPYLSGYVINSDVIVTKPYPSELQEIINALEKYKAHKAYNDALEAMEAAERTNPIGNLLPIEG